MERQRSIPGWGNWESPSPIFPEFLGVSPFVLIWQLQQALPVPERLVFEPALKSARDLPVIFNRLILLVPAGKEDSKWQIDRRYVQEYLLNGL